MNNKNLLANTIYSLCPPRIDTLHVYIAYAFKQHEWTSHEHHKIIYAYKTKSYPIAAYIIHHTDRIIMSIWNLKNSFVLIWEGEKARVRTGKSIYGHIVENMRVISA